jgi:hypothetical protein
VIRTMWGLRGSIRATSTMQNGGGSLRARIALTTTQQCRIQCRTRPGRPRSESYTQPPQLVWPNQLKTSS